MHVRIEGIAQGHKIETMSQNWEGETLYFIENPAPTETARQAATSAKRHFLTIALRPSKSWARPFLFC